MGAIKYSENDDGFNSVNEAIGLYIKQELPDSGIASSQFFKNKMLVVKTIRKGLPFAIFSLIKKITPFSDDDWANYLNLSTKTLQRYKNEQGFLFKPIHTEKILELTEVTNMGVRVFDNLESFHDWLNTTSLALGNHKPSELLQDSYGKELVLAELNRIEHGIFA
jgi:putative toxin-antitoxin system antitoxin component (TIGR02293 family)